MVAKRCTSGRKYRETCRDRRRPGTPELSLIFGKYKETCRSRKSRKLRNLGNRRQWQRLATQSTNFNKLCATHGKGFSRSWDKHMVSARRIEWRTSMWTQLFGVYLCLSLFKLQFILRKVTQKICDLSRINPRSLWDSYFKWLRFITDQTEITGLTTIDWQQLSWRETTLLTHRAVHIANWFWKHVTQRSGPNWWRADGVQVEIFTGFTTLGILDKIQKMMTWSKCEPEQFKRKDHLLVNVQWMTLIGQNEENKANCFANALRVI